MAPTRLGRGIEAPSRLRRAIEAVKDELSISLAKVRFRASLLSDLEVAIVKATKHDEYPADGRHINIILNLTCYSSSYVRSCVKTISRRIRETNTWTVALKTLMLVHRLLHEGDAAFVKEFFITSRYGTCLFDMSDFLDKTRLYSWDYSSFVRAYAMYLNNQLEQKMKVREVKHDNVFMSRDAPKQKVKSGVIIVSVAPVQEMKMEQIFTKIYCLMETLDLFLNCRPIGRAKTSRVVVVALYPVIKESFVLYNDIIETIIVLIRRFLELDIPESIKVHEILCRIAKQLDELDTFYKWCSSNGIGRCTGYPKVAKIPQVKLAVMEKYIREKQVEEHKRNSVKALPPMIEMKIHEVGDLINLDDDDSRSEEKEVATKIHQVADLITLDVDDSPKMEEHPDNLALSSFDGASKTEHSQWETFSDSVDWETELEYSAKNSFNQRETPTSGISTLLPNYGMHQQRVVNYEAGSTGSIGMPTMLALHTPYVQIEMKQRLPIEQQVI